MGAAVRTGAGSSTPTGSKCNGTGSGSRQLSARASTRQTAVTERQSTRLPGVPSLATVARIRAVVSSTPARSTSASPRYRHPCSAPSKPHCSSHTHSSGSKPEPVNCTVWPSTRPLDGVTATTGAGTSGPPGSKATGTRAATEEPSSSSIHCRATSSQDTRRQSTDAAPSDTTAGSRAGTVNEPDPSGSA